MTKSAILLIPMMLALALGFTPGEKRCHSEEFLLAKRKLSRIVLTVAQKDAIGTFEQRFQKDWAHTHRAQGCSHHEAHAKEFVAAAAGVLTDEQFKAFQGRERNEVDRLGHRLWENGRYLDNLLKLAAR